MIDATIDTDHALIRVVSGALDITYEVAPGVIYSAAGIASNGFRLDLVGVTRTLLYSKPYIFGSSSFDRALSRALSKAHHLERVWRKTTTRAAAAA